MKKVVEIFIKMTMAVAVMLGLALAPVNYAFADNPVETTIIPCDGSGTAEANKGDGIYCVLNLALNILTYGVGIAGTIGIVITGVQYLTARDNEQQLVKAKSRLFNIVIGLALYAAMWAILQFLLPGGIFGTAS